MLSASRSMVVGLGSLGSAKEASELVMLVGEVEVGKGRVWNCAVLVGVVGRGVPHPDLIITTGWSWDTTWLSGCPNTLLPPAPPLLIPPGPGEPSAACDQGEKNGLHHEVNIKDAQGVAGKNQGTQHKHRISIVSQPSYHQF